MLIESLKIAIDNIFNHISNLILLVTSFDGISPDNCLLIIDNCQYGFLFYTAH